MTIFQCILASFLLILLIYLIGSLLNRKDLYMYSKYLQDEITLEDYTRYKIKSEKRTIFLSIVVYIVIALTIILTF